MLQTGPLTDDRLGNEPGQHRATLHPQSAVMMERKVPRGVSNHEPTYSTVPDQDVGTQPQDEIRHAELTSREHRICEIVRRGGIVQQIRRAPDLERRMRGQRLVAAEPSPVQPCRQRVERVIRESRRHAVC